MICSVTGNVMENGIVRRADAASDGRVRQTRRATVRDLLRMIHKAVGVNHAQSPWGVRQP